MSSVTSERSEVTSRSRMKNGGRRRMRTRTAPWTLFLKKMFLKIPFLRRMSRKAGCLCQFRVAVGSFCLVFRLE